MATQVNHELKTFGPGFYLESGSDSVGIAGKTTYILHAETKDNVKKALKDAASNFVKARRGEL